MVVSGVLALLVEALGVVAIVSARNSSDWQDRSQAQASTIGTLQAQLDKLKEEAATMKADAGVQTAKIADQAASVEAAQARLTSAEGASQAKDKQLASCAIAAQEATKMDTLWRQAATLFADATTNYLDGSISAGTALVNRSSGVLTEINTLRNTFDADVTLCLHSGNV